MPVASRASSVNAVRAPAVASDSPAPRTLDAAPQMGAYHATTANGEPEMCATLEPFGYVTETSCRPVRNAV